jgi:UDP-glucuronate 4-epimerase
LFLRLDASFLALIDNFVKISMQTILISGGAGFIGSNLAEKLLAIGYKVIVVDNFDDYYDRAIKQQNISTALSHPDYTLIESDICNTDYLFPRLPSGISAIIHLAAKAGVRNSIIHPSGYEEENTKSISKAIELAVKINIPQFLFSSSSSIYGNSSKIPFCESQNDLNPINPYAKSKLMAENLGEQASKKYDLNFISLRFFSVYGPRLRPDLVMNKITGCILMNKPLKIFGNGSSLRDYTYVDDIINGIVKALDYKNKKFDIINLGSASPISLLEVIKVFENLMDGKIQLEFADAIKGESYNTWADNSKAKQLLNFVPETDITTGIKKYLDWYSLNND